MKNLSPLILIVTATIVLGTGFWWLNGTRAADSKNTKQQPFTVAKGEGARQIGNELKQAGLITDPYIFYALVKLGGYDGKIQAGDFELSPNQTPGEIIAVLTQGTQDVWITIPEGKRATEIAETLREKLPSYNTSWNQQLIAEEGYLFPDTYQFAKDATAEQIITTMKDNFNKKYAIASEGSTVKYSENDIVIIASIVEREGNNDNDMKYIASVLENRLQLGMALQVDSSIQYVLGNSFKWWPKPTAADLQIVSAYNTYKNPGLPPTPIANPGLTALTAALHPATANYLYYFTDGKGVTHFAKTLDEQNANIARYGL